MTAVDLPLNAIRAQAHLHHAYLLGLQLMVATREGPAVTGEWMFRLFRRQHEAKFLSSFQKLGLEGLPHADACARYHVLSNGIGGVAVQYMPEGPRKAWVRFRYPRWMYAGPTLCGVPVEVSRGFLRGWYAHNGVSLGNPRLGFVCVSEDMTGEFGFCGYFQEFDQPLSEDERLQFRRDERPPPVDPALQPQPPEHLWSADRLLKAQRNYALEYVRNGLCTLATVLGEARAIELGELAARLIGLQYWAETAAMVGAEDGGADAALDYLARMFSGMGDHTERDVGTGHALRQRGLRAVQGLAGAERALVLRCWCALWQGALASMQAIHRAEVQALDDGAGGGLIWRIAASGRRPDTV